MAAGDSIVIYNLNWDPAIATANAYVGDNRGAYVEQHRDDDHAVTRPSCFRSHRPASVSRSCSIR